MTGIHKVLVIGAGGREHALAWKLAQSNKVKHVYVAPGNGGTASEAKVSNLAITDIHELIKFARDSEIFFTVVGPEAPLANGIVDQFRAHDLKIWGPTSFCAQLESSKSFAKNFMHKYNIPTARYAVFTESEPAKEYLDLQSLPIVIKADGLAAGKGVLVAQTRQEAINFIDEIFTHNKFGNAGSKVVIEEFLGGVEASFIVMIDGKNVLPMASSQDHKRLLNNDLGPNTGGMGAYSPAPVVTPAIHDQVMQNIIEPVIAGMVKEGHNYTGFLYAGLMIDKDGIAKTLEFNCRFGDPETQPIMARLNSDLFDLIDSGINQKLDQITVSWDKQFALGVVLAAEGYPESPRKNDIINGLNELKHMSEIQVFHAGTMIKENNVYTDGGRVLCIVARDNDLKQLQHKVYSAIKKINFAGMQYRTDIGNKAYSLK